MNVFNTVLDFCKEHKMYVLPGLAVVALVGGLFVFNFYQAKSAKVNREHAVTQNTVSNNEEENAKAADAPNDSNTHDANETAASHADTPTAKPANGTVNKPIAPSAFEIITNTTSVAFVAGELSNKITVSTSDGRAVVWGFYSTTNLFARSTGSRAPLKTDSFSVLAINPSSTPPGTYSAIIEARDGSRVVQKSISIVVTGAKSYEMIVMYDQATGDETTGLIQIPYRFIRKNGHNAPIEHSAGILQQPGGLTKVSAHMTTADSGALMMYFSNPQHGHYAVHLYTNGNGYVQEEVVEFDF